MSWISLPERQNLVPDIVAGATFAIVNVPQGMANAVLASVNPVAGLYALMVAMPLGALVTSSVFMNVSTTGALSVATGDALVPFSGDEKTTALVSLMLMIGMIQLAFGLLNFGRLIRFVSHAVMTGFITGIAVLIMLGAVPDITGYSSTQSNHILRFADTVLRWRVFNYESLIVGFVTVGTIVALQRTRVRRFSLIIALVVAAAFAIVLGKTVSSGGIVLVGDVTDIHRMLPRPHLPNLTSLASLALPAFAIAVIGLIQSAGVGQNYPNPDGRFPDVSRDFVGQGVANLAAATFAAIPSGGSMSGTAVTVQAGARSRWANVFAGAFVVAIVFLLADFVKLVPMAGLGGLLLVVGFQNLQPESIRTVWNTGLTARVAMVATLAATLLMPLQFAILVGVSLSFVLQMFHFADRIEVREFEFVEGGFPIEKAAPAKLASHDITVLSIRGPLFFASAQSFEAQLPVVEGASRAIVILILRDINDLGSTVIRFLKRFADSLKQEGGSLVLAGVDEELFAQLDRTGMVDLIGVQNIFKAKPEVGAALNEAIAYSRECLDQFKSISGSPD